jgi:hypothetical protein
MHTDWRRKLDPRAAFGLVLVLIGALFLLQTLGLYRNVGNLMVSLVFLAGAAACVLVVLGDRRQWWALFPAFVLGFVGFEIGFSRLLRLVGGEGSLFLGGLGLCFLVIYAIRRDHWWPVIPGGVLLTLGALAGPHWYLNWMNPGALFFFGLAVTFAAVYGLAGARPQDSWALIVVAATAGLGLLILGGAILKFLIPLVLVGAGVYLLLRPSRNNP